MPQLVWNPLDFLTVLAVEPEVEEYGVYYRYQRETAPLWLTLTAWVYESAVDIAFGTLGIKQPTFAFTAFVRDRIVSAETREREWLEFRDAVFAPTRFCYSAMGPALDPTTPTEGFVLAVQVAPEIRLEFDRL